MKYRPGGPAALLVGTMLLASVALAVRGWVHAEMAGKLPWTPGGLQRALLLSAASWTVFALIAIVRPRTVAATVTGVALVTLAAFAGVLATGAVLLLLSGAAALGLALLAGRLRRPVTPADLPLVTALGLGVLSVVLGVLALAPVLTPLTMLAIVAAALPWQGRRLAALLREALAPSALRPPTRDLLLAGALVNVAVFACAAALMPEIGHDALRLHLAVAAEIRDAGSWHYDVSRNLMAVVPIGADYLYAVGYMYAGESGARLVNAASCALLLGITFCAIRSSASRSIALLATLVVATTPLVMRESASLFVDNPWAMMLVGSLVALDRFARDGDVALLHSGAALFGAAMATKAITLGALPGVAVLLACAARTHPGALDVRRMATAMAIAVLLALPPYAIAFATTGNPVFPFFNSIFRSPLYPAHDFSETRFPGTLDPRTLYRMTFYSDNYAEGRPGALGFSLLLLLLPTLVASLAWARSRAAPLLFAALALAAFVVANIAYLRYLYPALFLFAIALGVTLAAMPRGALRAAILAVAGGSVVLNAAFLSAAFGPLWDLDLATLTDARQRERFLSTWAPVRRLVHVLNALPDDGEPVAFLGVPSLVAELRRPAWVEGYFTPSGLDPAARFATSDGLQALVQSNDLGYVILGGQYTSPLRALVEGIASPVAAAGDAVLYRIHDTARYPHPLLQFPATDARSAGWVEHGRVVPNASGDGVVVDHQNLLYRQVGVQGDGRYRLAVRSRCHAGPARPRLQVIWSGRDATQQHVDAAAPSCTSGWTDATLLLRAPSWAQAAVVYATGDGPVPVEIANVSFRGR